jgi:hypothetical protein
MHSEVLPQLLVLHLKRFWYDAVAGGVIKIGKSIRFSSELEIPIGTPFVFTPEVFEAENTTS